MREVGYLIVGAGPAGLSTAADISEAPKEIESHHSIFVVEKNDYVCGRFQEIGLEEPDSYAGPALRGSLGASRTNPSTFPNTRRQKTNTTPSSAAALQQPPPSTWSFCRLQTEVPM